MLLDDALYVETPEGVQLVAVLADPLSRAQALLCDVLLIVAGVFVLAFLSTWLFGGGAAAHGIFSRAHFCPHLGVFLFV